MQTDKIKLLFTYLIALLVVIGGGVFLFLTLHEPGAESTRLLVGGFMGSAITFVFAQESAKAATRAAEGSIGVGAATVTNAAPPPAPPPNPTVTEGTEPAAPTIG